MDVKLYLVLGLTLISSVWISTCTSAEINSPNPQEHQKDDKISNIIQKQPKTEAEIKYVNKDTQTSTNKLSEIKNETESKEDQYEKQNEVEKDNESKSVNTIKKDTIPKRREGNSRSIDIDKYVSPEFQNNEFTLPTSSDTEKYLDEPFSFKTSAKMVSELDRTTPKISMFTKFIEPVQKLEQEYEDHLKGTDHEFSDDHIDLENDNDEEHEIGDHHYEKEDDEQDRDVHESDHHDTEEITVDKMIERSESVPRNISVDWEMKISKDDPDKSKHKNFKNFTVVKYRKVDYITHFNDTKIFATEPKGDVEILNATTTKPLTSTTRKNNMLTKPPNEKNNSHLLSNKIETETIKAINIGTTESLSTKKPKGDEGSNEQTVEENQLSRTVTIPLDQNIHNGSIENTTSVNNEKITNPVDQTDRSSDEAVFSTQISTLGTTEVMVKSNDSTNDSTSQYIGDTTTMVKSNDSTIDSTSQYISDTTTQIVPISTDMMKAKEKMLIDNNSSNESSVQHITDVTLEPETTTFYPSTTEFHEEDIYLGTDITTTTDLDLTTVFVARNLRDKSFKDKKVDVDISKTMYTTLPTTISEFSLPTETRTTDISTTTESTPETSTVNLNTDVTTETVSSITTEPPLEYSTIVRSTEDVATTNHASEIMSDGTTVVPEANSQTSNNEIIKTDIIAGTNKNETVRTTTEELRKSNTQSPTTEVNFVHVETTGMNQTTFIPETLSPNFSYPIANADNKERIATRKNVSSVLAETTTTDDPEDTTSSSSSTEPIVVEEGGNKEKIAAIVISTVGAVCLVALAGLLYVMKKRQRKFNYKQRCRPVSLDDYSVDNLSVYNSVRRKGVDRQSKRSYGNPAFDDPSVTSHPLNFPALAKFATNVDDMKAEFEEIPQITARANELPEGCETKNRYANVIPLPESRVYLKSIQGVPNSDYINANYVTGPKNTRGYYIACQAPKQNTVDDFWRMIWEQQCKVILMITHLFENGVEKCVDYLPPSEVLDCHRLFGDFQVTLKKREAKEKYIISSIQLKNMVSNSWRDVTHFWYLGWPEKGIPSEANSLIAFLIEARSYMKTATLEKDMSPNDMRDDPSQNELNPVVVHCSPGTGRTGVVIACDIAIREFEKIRLVDIPKIVYRIRRDRANAVQTKEQYMFIYKVISLYATKLTGGALESF